MIIVPDGIEKSIGGYRHERINPQKLRRPAAVSQCKLVAQVLGVSISTAYEVMHEPGFPTLRVAAAWWYRKKSSFGGRRNSPEVRNEKADWTKRDPIKNYFPLPNEIYDLGLSRGAISVYSFLLRRRIARPISACSATGRSARRGMCVTTVRKYVAELEERSLIRTERTTVTTKDGRKRNGRLLYHILPIQLAIDQYYERQMDMADLALEQHKAKQRLAALERKECASGC